MYSVAAENCYFPNEKIGKFTVKVQSECVELCEDDPSCTAYFLAGTGPYWCVLQKGDAKLEDAAKYNGISKCAVLSSLLNKM